ncbi:hypothetical protein RINTHM_180 [Richelia intracellularis HM01]|uniref:hypothetical protein n=1 Tax=Richelia intracellularis TaxID=1164990 RepID=UPI0002B4E840|nr:hypothetical protein [Richelia intracellularis]CCH64501.1 hypothetical protein RINTHM_180 [Richelia intracellularis HM01]
MEHGLLWFPLLAIFIWLFWQGGREYQKVEAYHLWAEKFDRAKYDILAVIGQKDNNITWGKPTHKGIANVQTFSLLDVKKVAILVGTKEINIDVDDIPTNGNTISLKFFILEPNNDIQIPFTEVPLAISWCKFLQNELQQIQS